jgi:DNA-binding HxlR family transcriptional regulator
MRWNEIGEVRCSVARALSVVGDRWTLLLLRDLFLGARRFEHFEASLGASPHLLSTRLRKLVDHGIVERRPYQEKPVRHEYRLTAKGRDLYPVMVGLVGWGDRWMSDEHGPPVTFEHKTCGHSTHPELHCSECGEPLRAQDVRAHLSVSAPVAPTERTS